MKKKQKFTKSIYLILLICTLVLSSFSFAFADMGPKPSIEVNVYGIKGEYYATILSSTDSVGPWSIDRAFEDMGLYGENYTKEAWDIFKAYEDKDNFYFVGFMDVCRGEDSFAWTYMRPEIFNVISCTNSPSSKPLQRFGLGRG